MSVIIPVYNREDLLPETLDSVRAQTFEDWECIVVDDGSTDRSFEVAQRYAAEDPRFRALQRDGGPKGANRCRNQGLAASAGDYVIFLDSDDLLAPECLSGRSDVLEREEDLGYAVFGASRLCSGGPVPTFGGQQPAIGDCLTAFLGRQAPWFLPQVMWRRRATALVGEWDPDLLSWQDSDYHMRALVTQGLLYRRVSSVDCYIRPPGGRATVGSTRHTPLHLVGHERVVLRIVSVLLDRHEFTSERRMACGVRLWTIARRWARIGYLTQAIRVWHRSVEWNAVGPSRYVVGIGLLAAGRLGCRTRTAPVEWPAGLSFGEGGGGRTDQ